MLIESMSKEEYLTYPILAMLPLKKLGDICDSSDDKIHFETLIKNKLSEKELNKLQKKFVAASVLSRISPLYLWLKRYCHISDNTSFFKSLFGQEKLFSFIK